MTPLPGLSPDVARGRATFRAKPGLRSLASRAVRSGMATSPLPPSASS